MSGAPEQVTAVLADIGGTNARFALVEEGNTSEVLHLNVADHESAYDALNTALDQFGAPQPPPTAVLAFAGPVDASHAFMTNTGWETRTDELRQRFGFSHVELMNDYAALALGLSQFTDDDRHQIGPKSENATGNLAVIGPGSGLGVAALLPNVTNHLALVGEGGHTTVPAASDLEAALIAVLRKRLGHVSAERLLSGPGLVNIYQALAQLDGTAAEAYRPAEVTRRGLEGSDDLCRRALERFCAFLGSFSGNMALCYGARGGVYLGGGILPRFPEFLAASEFRERFEAKGRLRSYLSGIPTWLITRPDATFAGLAVAARRFG